MTGAKLVNAGIDIRDGEEEDVQQTLSGEISRSWHLRQWRRDHFGQGSISALQ